MRVPLHWTALLTLTLLCACQVQSRTPAAAAGVQGGVTLPIRTVDPAAQSPSTIRTGDVTVTRLGPASVQRAGGFDYLRAPFEVKNVGTTPIVNLTLVAVARAGTVGGTSITSITEFGGIPGHEQAALTPLVAPTQAVAVSPGGGLNLVARAADFAALPDAEVAALPGQPGWNTVYGPQDTPLNYGFTVGRCQADTCTRTLNPGESGTVNVALRVPNGAAVGATYDFLMNFALVQDPVTRVTRSLVPPESAADALTRLEALNAPAGEVMQLAPLTQALPAGRTGQTVPAVRLSRDGADLLTALTTMQTTPLGAVKLTLSPDDRTVTRDASGTLEFTPGVFTDVDDVQGGLRYVTRTFEVRNLSDRTLPHVTLRAITRPGNLGGTAIVEIRGAPTGSDPQGPPVTDPAFAQAFRPVHRVVLGATRPELDLGGASFQAYRASESQVLTGHAALGEGATALDYGFTISGAGTRTLAPGDVTRINVAFRFPRRFGTQPRPYAAQLSFVAATDTTVRVSQADGESRTQLQSRAQALLGAQEVQVATTDGGPLLPSDVTGLLTLSTPGVRVNTGATLEPGTQEDTDELRSER